MKKNLFLFVCVLVFCNCTQKQKEGIIQVNLDDAQIINSNLFIDSIRYVKLETTDLSIVSNIRKILMDDERIYILDNLSKIYVFDKEGKFQYVIDKIGQGPEEYISASNISLNRMHPWIEILDLYSYKVFFYDVKNGDFIDSYALIDFSYAIFPMENGFYLSNVPFFLEFPNGKEFGVNILDSQFVRVKELINYTSAYPTCGQDYGIFSELEDGEYAVFSQVEGAVYHLQDTIFKQKYCFEFKNRLKPKSFKGVESFGLSENEMRGIVDLFFYKETNACIFSDVTNGQRTASFLYLKETNQIFVIGGFERNEHIIEPQLFVKSDTKNIIFSAVPVEPFIEGLKIYPDGPEGADKEFVDFVKNSKFEDNPILQIIYLKH